MSRFADLVIKDDRTPEEDQELHVLAQQLDYVVADVGTVIGPSGTVARLRAGSVVLDNAGMHTYLGGVETGRIEADGDFLLGSNIATAANTSFAVFSNAQTYNSESIGAGDLLIGDNTASKANILWDKSTGKLEFRGGTTVQGYINTDGSATFGAGNVTLSSGGIVIKGTSELMQFQTAAGGAVATLFVDAAENLQLRLDGAGAWTFSEGDVIIEGTSTDDPVLAFHESGVAKSRLWYDASDNNLIIENVETGVASIVNVISNDTGVWDFLVSGEAGPEHRLVADPGTAVVFNEQGRDIDFRVETDGNTHTIFAEGSTNRVGILNSSPSEALDVTGNIAVSGTVDGIDIAALDAVVVKHTLADAENDFLVASGDDTFVKKTLAETSALLGAGGGYTEGARVYRTAVQSIPNKDWTALLFTHERWDITDIHDTGSNTERLTCVEAGKYVIVGQATMNLAASDRLLGQTVLNDTDIIGSGWSFVPADVTPRNVRMMLTTIYDLAEDDYVTFEVYHDYGVNRDIMVLANYSPEFMMQRIG